MAGARASTVARQRGVRGVLTTGAVRIDSTGGVSLALHDLGGTGDPLLIAHATGFCGRTYEPLAKHLTAVFHVWALDFRGHGDSTAPTNDDFSWSGMGDDAMAALVVIMAASRRGADRRVIGFGHSMGGAALLLAELARPGLLCSAHLYEPIVPVNAAPLTGSENPLAHAARRRRSSFPSKAAALERYATRTPLGELRADALGAYVEHGFVDRADGAVELKCQPEHEARTFEAEGKLTVDRLGKLHLPTTVAVGGRTDDQGPAIFAPGVVKAIPGAVLVEYSHVGHFGPLQDPQTIAEDIVAASGGR